MASSPPQLFNIYIYLDIERNLFWLEFSLSNTYRIVVLHGRAAPQILGYWCACIVPRHRWLNFSYGRNLTLSLVHLDLAGAKISASASQVTPLAELIEMVQYIYVQHSIISEARSLIDTECRRHSIVIRIGFVTTVCLFRGRDG